MGAAAILLRPRGASLTVHATEFSEITAKKSVCNYGAIAVPEDFFECHVGRWSQLDSNQFPPALPLLRHFRFRAGVLLRAPLVVSEEHVSANRSAAAFTGPHNQCVLTKGLQPARLILARIRRKVH